MTSQTFVVIGMQEISRYYYKIQYKKLLHSLIGQGPLSNSHGVNLMGKGQSGCDLHDETTANQKLKKLIRSIPSPSTFAHKVE